MVTIQVEGDTLALEVQGMDKLWAFKSRLEIPLKHIRAVRVDAALAGHPEGWRELGTCVPGVLTAGTLRSCGKRIFWDVRDPEKAIVLDLKDDRYEQLIVEVEDANATVRQIEAALRPV